MEWRKQAGVRELVVDVPTDLPPLEQHNDLSETLPTLEKMPALTTTIVSNLNKNLRSATINSHNYTPSHKYVSSSKHKKIRDGGRSRKACTNPTSSSTMPHKTSATRTVTQTATTTTVSHQRENDFPPPPPPDVDRGPPPPLFVPPPPQRCLPPKITYSRGAHLTINVNLPSTPVEKKIIKTPKRSSPSLERIGKLRHSSRSPSREKSSSKKNIIYPKRTSSNSSSGYNSEVLHNGDVIPPQPSDPPPPPPHDDEDDFSFETYSLDDSPRRSRSTHKVSRDRGKKGKGKKHRRYMSAGRKKNGYNKPKHKHKMHLTLPSKPSNETTRISPRVLASFVDVNKWPDVKKISEKIDTSKKLLDKNMRSGNRESCVMIYSRLDSLISARNRAILKNLEFELENIEEKTVMYAQKQEYEECIKLRVISSQLSAKRDEIVAELSGDS